jgi:hypothetical protein
MKTTKLLLTLLLSATIIPIFAQNDALKILENGNVGIGTTTPEATLDVKGTIKATDISVTENLRAAKGNFTGILETNGFQVNGIGATLANAFVGDVGNGPTWAGFSHLDAIRQESYGFLHHNTGTKSLLNIKSSDAGFIGFRVNNKDKMVLLSNGNVGIGTKTPSSTLDVNGTIKTSQLQASGAINAASLNGDRPPIVFEVGTLDGAVGRWQAVNKDIGSYCGDADGCTIKLLLLNVTNDQVRTISEQIYMEQPNKTKQKTAGISGWTRQSGGGDSYFILNATNKDEVIPRPWEWMFIRNFGDARVLNGSSTVLPGYTVQFLTHPNVFATVIIYDH